MRNLILIFVLFIIISSGKCKSDEPTEEKPLTKTNIIVLLDLSDRILNTDQIDRDKIILYNLYSSFLKKVQSQLYFQSKDEFKVTLSYQENTFQNTEIFDIENKLYVNMDQIPIDKKVEIRDSKPSFQEKIRELYKLARFSERDADYLGADIQGYLQNRLAEDLRHGEDVHNKLIIITDGYQYVSGKSLGLESWPIVTSLSDVDVCVLELTPNENIPNEQQRMDDFWKNWMKSMNAKSIEIIFQDALIQENEKINQFILGDEKPLISSENNDVQINENKSQSLSGSFHGFINKNARTIELKLLSENSKTANYICDFIPMGDDYSKLKGIYNKELKLLQIDKIGAFGVDANQDNICIISNEWGATFCKN